MIGHFKAKDKKKCTCSKLYSSWEIFFSQGCGLGILKVLYLYTTVEEISKSTVASKSKAGFLTLGGESCQKYSLRGKACMNCVCWTEGGGIHMDSQLAFFFFNKQNFFFFKPELVTKFLKTVRFNNHRLKKEKKKGSQLLVKFWRVSQVWPTWLCNEATMHWS